MAQLLLKHFDDTGLCYVPFLKFKKLKYAQ